MITLAAFLAHNFWIYILAAAALLLMAVQREPNKLAMFFFLLFALPLIQDQISGLGIIQHFFTIHYVRLLVLVVLLKAFLALRKQPDTERFGRLLPDKLIGGYMALNFGLMLSVGSFTGSLRGGIFYAFIDIFLPYYVASRSLKKINDFRDALMSFAVAALVLSAIGAFEFTKHWLLYSSLDNALGVNWDYGGYLLRGDLSLRAQATAGQPIPLGYIMAVALGFYLYLRKSVPSISVWVLGLAALIVGLIVPLSRGPWIGAAIMILFFLLTGPSPVRRIMQVALLSSVVLPVLLATPIGDKIVALLPFVGNVDEVNISYRQHLLEVGIQSILQHPLFGGYGLILSPETQDLKQGNGMVDLVNTYLGVGLASGLVGLSLFLGFFIAAAVGVAKRMSNVDDKYGELHLLGRALLSTLIGILVIICTTSSITVIPVIYWSVAGVCVAYAHMPASHTSRTRTKGVSECQMIGKPPPIQRVPRRKGSLVRYANRS